MTFNIIDNSTEQIERKFTSRISFTSQSDKRGNDFIKIRLFHSNNRFVQVKLKRPRRLKRNLKKISFEVV